MANLQEVVSWEAGIYQLETGDPVLGGPGGISNKQAQALANRTAYLKKHVDDIEGGNTAAGKANKLSTARNIALAGDVTGQAAFDGSGNITITATYKNSGVVAGTYRSVTVDAKGNITAGSNPTTLAGYGITDAVSSTQYATEATRGIAPVATQAEVNAGTDDTKFVTAKKLMAWVKQASEAVLGLIKVATQAQTDAGTADDVAITPKKLRYGFSIQTGASGYIALPSWLGGWICQWGSSIANTADSVNGTLNTFPMTYPNACSMVVPSDYGTASAACASFATGSYTASTFRCWARNPATAGTFVTAVGRYISIGN
ncbi:gp53-like domain-containing protein [Aeromonas veronii]|uniref:gp53-like domain-containing protein n=1 Tax=Aeromonas veronii TaxID=654 RepID=UPI003F7C9D6C